MRSTTINNSSLNKPSTSSTVPWIEKYRPKSLEDVTGQDDVVNALKSFLVTGNLPHLLFYGPPGTGKTSTALGLTKDLFGPDFYRSRLLELNASDERGIQIVREKIKSFAKLAANEKVEGYPCPSFKIIILDEADSMTADAQSALRRVMETYAQVTRFCIVCNYVSRIIDPITSRCAKFRFKSLPKEKSLTRLEDICKNESIQISHRGLDKIYTVTDGDLRRGIMFLQGVSKLLLPSNNENPVSDDGYDEEKIIDEISGVIPVQIIDEFWETCKNVSIDVVISHVREKIIGQAYSASQFLAQLYRSLVSKSSEKITIQAAHMILLSNIQKSLIVQKIASVDNKLTIGADETLQLLDFAAFAFKTIHHQQ